MTLAKQLSAITALAENITTASSQILTVYQQSGLGLEPEDFICHYCQFLAFIVGHKIKGDKHHLHQLIIDSIKENTGHGRHLHQTIAQYTAKNGNSIQEIGRAHV